MVLVLFGGFLARGFEFLGTPTSYPPKGSTFSQSADPPRPLCEHPVARGFEFFGTPTPYPPKGSTFYVVFYPPTLRRALVRFPQTPSGGILKENPALSADRE